MVQCEMCGTETGAPTTVKIEGAELDVCDSCAEFGTTVQPEQSSSTATKYSTSGSDSTGTDDEGTSSQRSSSSHGGDSGGRRRDMFDEMDEVAQDYHERIRSARESMGLSQQELAKQLNEKASLIKKLEHGDTLPSDQVQRKLERALDIDLTEGTAAEGDAEWEGGTSTGSYTLGDVVERKD